MLLITCHLSHQSVVGGLIVSLGYSYTIPENFSRADFSAMNSSKNSLYFSSDIEVHLDANIIGCICVPSFSPNNLVVICCASIAFKAMNVFVCFSFHFSSSLNP